MKLTALLCSVASLVASGVLIYLFWSLEMQGRESSRNLELASTSLQELKESLERQEGALADTQRGLDEAVAALERKVASTNRIVAAMRGRYDEQIASFRRQLMAAALTPKEAPKEVLVARTYGGEQADPPVAKGTEASEEPPVPSHLPFSVSDLIERKFDKVAQRLNLTEEQSKPTLEIFEEAGQEFQDLAEGYLGGDIPLSDMRSQFWNLYDGMDNELAEVFDDEQMEEFLAFRSQMLASMPGLPELVGGGTRGDVLEGRIGGEPILGEPPQPANESGQQE